MVSWHVCERRAAVWRRAALGLVLVSALAVVFLSAVSAAFAAKPEVNEYAILIDTSKSMAGFQGSKNIFPAVKKAVNKYVDRLPEGSVVYINSFDSSLTKRAPVTIKSDADRSKIKATVDGLKADGPTTAIYSALSGTFDELATSSRADPGAVHNQNILLFTDGKDNQSGMTFAQIARKFSLARSDNPNLYLTYVTLGTSADPRWGDVDGVTVIQNPVNPTIHSLAVRPARLNFGSLFEADASQPQTIQITFDAGLQGKSLGLTAISKKAEGAGALLTVEPSMVKLEGIENAAGLLVMTQQVTLGVENRDTLDQSRDYAGQIELFLPKGKDEIIMWAPRMLPFTFTLAPLPHVTIEMAGGQDGKLGKLDPYSAEDGVVDKQLDFAASFNSQADSEGSSVTVRLEPAAGTPEGAAVLQGPDGQATDGTIELTPQQTACSLVVTVKKGQEAGAYVYDLLFEPSEGLTLSGLTVDPDKGAAVMPVTFAVPRAPLPPPPPRPLWQVILFWVLVVLGILIAVFIVVSVLAHRNPLSTLGLALNKSSPGFKDARVNIVAPSERIQQIELTGQKSYEIGPALVPGLPCTLRFEPQVAVLAGTNEAMVSIAPSDGGAYFNIQHAATGIDEPTTKSAVGNGDIIRVELTDGRRLELVFQSYDYITN